MPGSSFSTTSSWKPWVTPGDDTPGVIPSRASTEVQEALANMDVVIAKG